MSQFPVQEVMPQIIETLYKHNLLILSAPPGSGKTTQVPLSLLKEQLFTGRILLLQPRRVAARSVATWLAHLLDEPVGLQVGYQVRHEKRLSSETKIEVLTEGLIIQRLLSDPELSGVDLVILDEFHERSLLSDLSLMMLREAQLLSRDDLKLIIMSATLNSGELAKRFQAPYIEAKGRSFPLDIIYIKHKIQTAPQVLAEEITKALKTFWLNTDESSKNSQHDKQQTQLGHCLVFLPGKREIELTKQLLLQGNPRYQIDVLYGALSLHQQKTVLQKSPQPKLILSTNIAETSLTIEGVTHVIDSGLYRSARLDPKTGLTRLLTLAIAQDSATQRAGRAGRTQAGQCLRLWPKHEHEQRHIQSASEVSYSDLVEAVLKVASWAGDWRLFEWFEEPPNASLQQAVEELSELQAIDLNSQKLSNLGQSLARLPIHPRQGLALLWGLALDCLEEVSFICALAELAHDPFTEKLSKHQKLDPWARWHYAKKDASILGRDFDLTVQQLKRYARRESHIIAQFQVPKLQTLSEKVAFAFARSHSRRIGKLRSRSQDDWQLLYHLSGGGEAQLNREYCLEFSSYIVALKPRLNLKGQAIIELALGIREDWLMPIESETLVFDQDRGGVFTKKSASLGALKLWTKQYPAPRQSQAAQVLFQKGISQNIWQWLSLEPEAKRWLERLKWLSTQEQLRIHLENELDTTYPIWEPNPNQQGRQSESNSLTEQLSAYLFSEVTHINQAQMPPKILPLLKGLSNIHWVKAIDHYAPDYYELPTGQKVKVDYSQKQPSISAFLQAFFGEIYHPYLGQSSTKLKTPLQLKLLAPNRRVTQITSDLPSFWSHSYPSVRKDLRGRYPKHFWPKDPLSIGPQKGVKRRK